MTFSWLSTSLMAASARSGSVMQFLNGAPIQLIARAAGERLHLLVDIGNNADQLVDVGFETLGKGTFQYFMVDFET
jgi:hypothetical protein